jgi:hypothetical protein
MPVLDFQADDALRQVRYRSVPSVTVKGISNQFHKKDGEVESDQNPVIKKHQETKYDKFLFYLFEAYYPSDLSRQICWAQGCGAERSPSRSAKQQIGMVGGHRLPLVLMDVDGVPRQGVPVLCHSLGNGLCMFMPPIYGDLGDGLWHCFFHIKEVQEVDLWLHMYM